MKNFLNQNRTFLILALTITLLALFKVNQAHASNTYWIPIHGDTHYDKNSIWSPKKGIYRFEFVEIKFDSGSGQRDGQIVGLQYELNCAEATARYMFGWVGNAHGRVNVNPKGTPDEFVRYGRGSAFYHMDRLLCKR